MSKFEFDSAGVSDTAIAEMLMVEFGLLPTAVEPVRPKPISWQFTDLEMDALSCAHDVYQLTGDSVKKMIAENRISVNLSPYWREQIPSFFAQGNEPREVAIPRDKRAWLLSPKAGQTVEQLMSAQDKALNEMHGTSFKSKLGSLRDYIEIAAQYRSRNPDARSSIFGSINGRASITTTAVKTTTETFDDNQFYISNGMIVPDGLETYNWTKTMPEQSYISAPIIYATTPHFLIKR